MCERSATALASAGEALERAAEFLDALTDGRVERDDTDAIRDACTSTADAMHLAYVAARAARAEGRDVAKLRAAAVDFVAAVKLGPFDADDLARYVERFVKVIGAPVDRRRTAKTNAAPP